MYYLFNTFEMLLIKVNHWMLLKLCLNQIRTLIKPVINRYIYVLQSKTSIIFHYEEKASSSLCLSFFFSTPLFIYIYLHMYIHRYKSNLVKLLAKNAFW